MENHGTRQGIIPESSISDLNFAERYVTDQNNDGESSSGNNSVISENINSEIWNFGRPTFKCRYRNALMWYEERIRPNTCTKNPYFGIYCGNGKIRLPARPAPPCFPSGNFEWRRYEIKELQNKYTVIHSHLLEG
jgi:hypothetical protein